MPESKSKTIDHYAVLGVTNTATTAEIQSAFRKLSLKCHPDKKPSDSDAAAKFQQLKDCRDVLVDPEERQHYDKLLSRQKGSSPRERPSARNPCAEQSRSAYGADSKFEGRTTYSQPSYDRSGYARPERNQYEPSRSYRDTAERPATSRPGARGRPYDRRGTTNSYRGYQHEKYETSSRRPPPESPPQRETKSNAAEIVFGGYCRPIPSRIRYQSHHTHGVYYDILDRCGRIYKKAYRARKTLGQFEDIGKEELRAVERQSSDFTFTECTNTGMFCIIVDVLFEVLEASSETYCWLLRRLEGEVPETRDAMPLLIKIDAQVRNLDDTWLFTDGMLDIIDQGLEHEGWPIRKITPKLERILDTWNEDLELPRELRKIIDVVRTAKKFSYEMSRSDKVIDIDRS